MSPKRILLVASMGGCGTHLTRDLMEKAGYFLFEDFVPLISAMLEPGNEATLAAKCREFGVAPPANSADKSEQVRCLKETFASLGHERLGVVNEFAFSPPVFDFLNDLKDQFDADIARAAFIRHPVDIFLSRRERSGETLADDIQTFFGFIGGEQTKHGVTICRYEDLCDNDPANLRRTLERLNFDAEDIARIDPEMVHSGSTAKWQLYPRAEVDPLADRFGPIMAAHGYDCRTPGPLAGLIAREQKRFAKYVAEIKVMNRIFAGDFSVDGAFSRHQRSLLGRIWFRIKLMSPRNRENVRQFYLTRKGADLPARPLWVIFRDFVSNMLARQPR